MALRLYGVTLLDSHHTEQGVNGTELLGFRDLAAVVTSGQFQQEPPPEEEIQHYQQVVDAVFNRRAVLPAPVGTVFRSRETLVRWMELHYVALSDALSFVEDRAVARVHIRRRASDPDARDKGTDLAAAAAETFRALRRRAAAAIPLKTEHLTGIVLSSAFLVERELWKEFMSVVASEQDAHGQLSFEVTGPWPPYDFVRMQFGG
jgi:Gas vesicle synthesis protein GvpL/GvpF